MKTLTQYICESASANIKKVTSNLKLNFDIDPLDYYVYMQDELEEDSSEKDINEWINEQIKQIVIDIHNIDKSVISFNNSKDFKQFMKLFVKDYKNEPYFNIAMKLYIKLSEITDHEIN